MDRLFPFDLVRGHFKSLYAGASLWLKVVLTLAIYGVPTGVAAVAWLVGLDTRVLAPLLTAMSLLSGGTLSAFGQLSTLRLRLTDRLDRTPQTEKPDRRMFDESATHLLFCATMAMVTAMSVVVTMMTVGGAPRICGLNAAWILWATTLTAILFWIAVPRIYLAYVNINRVDHEVDGTFRDR